LFSAWVSESSRALNSAQAGFGMPPPFSGVLITCLAEVTTSTSTGPNGILSPGFTTVCLVFEYSSAYFA
jgi:hypothetical protein